MNDVVHLSVSIGRPAADVYAFASDPRNLPRWAAGLARSEVRQEGDAWVAEAPFGTVRVTFAPDNPYGVLDHDVRLESGVVVHNVMRVVPRGAGSELTFMLVRQPGMSDRQLEEDRAAVERDLRTLKDLLEEAGAVAMSSNDGRRDEPREREIVSARTFDAPRARVFAAFSDPARLVRWWGPDGFTSTVHAFELRPGGRWHLTMHGPDGADYPSESVFEEVDAPGRLVFRHLSAGHPYEMEITLEERGGATTMTWRMRHATARECERVRPFVVAANEQNFDRLAAELAGDR